MNSELPLVSVIIPARDSAVTLRWCLESIGRQTYPRIETIVVDNGSRDQTPHLAAEHGAIVLSADGLRTAARNRGARAASGDFLLHLDSDMELGPTVIAQCFAATQKGATMVILPERNVSRGYWVRAFSFGKVLFSGIPGFENARFIQRDAFDAVNGYDVTLEMGEDADLHLRLLAAGNRLGRIDAVTLHHVGHLTLGAILRKSRFYDTTHDRYLAKHGRRRPDGPSHVEAILANRAVILRHPIDAAGWFVVTGLIIAQSKTYTLREKVSKLARRLSV